MNCVKEIGLFCVVFAALLSFSAPAFGDDAIPTDMNGMCIDELQMNLGLGWRVNFIGEPAIYQQPDGSLTISNATGVEELSHSRILKDDSPPHVGDKHKDFDMHRRIINSAKTMMQFFLGEGRISLRKLEFASGGSSQEARNNKWKSDSNLEYPDDAAVLAMIRNEKSGGYVRVKFVFRHSEALILQKGGCVMGYLTVLQSAVLLYDKSGRARTNLGAKPPEEGKKP